MGKRAGPRAAWGDYQTPPALAERVCARLQRLCQPATLVEPTCGVGNLLAAGAEAFPRARCLGFELSTAHVAAARARLGPRATIERVDVFRADWGRRARAWGDPVLVLGNPPWVTSADQTAIGGANLPLKTNLKRLAGYDAVSGKGNFDVSEWIVLELLARLQGRDATLAMLIKSSVARRVLEYAWTGGLALRATGLWRIDARREFGAAVDACLLVCATADRGPPACPVYDGLEDRRPRTRIGLRGGGLVADVAAWTRARALVGVAAPAWRSGIKHDCARVMELRADGDALVNGLGERVTLDPATIFPLCKSSDLARGDVSRAHRWVIVPQRRVGEDTARLEREAPRTWAYLSRHRDRLDARRSVVYRGKPPFSIFGVGDYAFCPWKVAISGLYQPARFTLLGPVNGRPVMLDDTCYLLGFDREDEARAALELLRSPAAADVLDAHVFWDMKRPITKEILGRLELARLAGVAS
ncbi:MAG: class I SAM-dependent methyltransferase [Nannocystaceae bacterium]|nr:hypothetical protein [Myxococcales bacterium]